MKSKLFIAAIIALTGSVAHATVTLAMSSTSNYATNFLSGTGANTTLMAWGVVVDTAGNGFQGTAANPYASFGNISANVTGSLVLSTLSGGVSDDVLYISSSLMNAVTAANDSSVVGMNRITTLSSMVYANGVAAGKQYEVIWFDVTAFGTASQGVKYGMYDLGSTALAAPWGSAADLLPADPGSYVAAPAFAGADTAKSMTMQIGIAAIPETSTALLGALGVLGLLRRRR